MMVIVTESSNKRLVRLRSSCPRGTAEGLASFRYRAQQQSTYNYGVG